MKSVRWFSLLVALVTVCLLLTACSQPDTNSAGPGSSSPVPGANNPPAASSPTVAVNVPPPPYQGAVDFRDCEAVGGWVVAKNSQAETKVEFYIDDKLIDSAPATKLRPDLTSWGTGRHGFSFKMPAAYKDGKPHTVKIKVVGSDFVVPFFSALPGFECKA
jgi:hypothetical protein